MSRYSRCPYQNASMPPAPPPHAAPQHHLRNPWVAGDRGAGESQSTNSSSSSRTYRGGPGGGGGGGGGPGPPVWHAPPPPPLEHYNHHPPRPSHYLIDHQAEVLDGLSATHHLLAPPGGQVAVAVAAGGVVGVVGARGVGAGALPGAALPLPLPFASAAASSSRAASDRDRPLTPASSPGGVSGSHPGGGSAAAVDGCGGHCVAFENFCYRCLQVIFIAGILTGVSLTIAGSVLRHPAPPSPRHVPPSSPFDFHGGGDLEDEGGDRSSSRGDLSVLVYIGCMLGLVCALLLAVQCCVRRNVKRRKRALRASATAAGRGRTGTGTLTMHNSAAQHAHAHALHGAHALHAQQGHGGDIPLQDLQYQPLLMRLVQQQQANAAAAAASSSSSGNQRLSASAGQGASLPAPVPATHLYHRPAPAHAHAAYRDDLEELEASCSGVPWWRRGDHRQHARPPHVAETRR